MILKIMPEFKTLIAPLSNEEFAQLEANILTDGCRNPIAVWRGYIIDGHHRYRVCMKHDIPFETISMKFNSRMDAKVWIADNQLGRRNLSSFRMIELAMIVKSNLKDLAEANQIRGGSEKAAPEQKVNFVQAVADAAGTGKGQVRKFQKIVKVADPDTIDKLRSGEMKIGSAYRLLVEERTNKKIMDTIRDVDQNGVPLCLDIMLKQIQEAGKACDFAADSLDFNSELAKSKTVQNNLERMHDDVMYLVKSVKALIPLPKV